MPFLATSRYHQVDTIETKDALGRDVEAIKLRALDTPEAASYQVEDEDRLDIIADQRYSDPTRFWHIADANTEMEANLLVAETGRTIQVPESS